MKRLVLLLFFGIVAAGCSGGPKPLPKGPPPEYEPARDYDGGTAGDELPGAP